MMPCSSSGAEVTWLSGISENAVGNLGFALAKYPYSLSAPFPIIHSAMHLWMKRYFALKKLTKKEESIWAPSDKRL